jgi:3-methyladenine DNA glycosylase AlkD
MDAKSVLRELESLGTAQNRKVYGRHGVSGPMFGVSFKHLGMLTKKLKKNHALAGELWASGNHDARMLATMIADPAKVDGPTAERWAADLDHYGMTAAVAKLVSRSPVARAKAAKWTKSNKEWLSSAGWTIMAHLAMDDAELPDSFFAELVPIIAKRIHAAPNYTGYSMNNALIAIGVRNAKLRKLAVAAARQIGRVEVDHGQTSCQTPDAAAYIAKTVAYRKQKAAAK